MLARTLAFVSIALMLGLSAAAQPVPAPPPALPRPPAAQNVPPPPPQPRAPSPQLAPAQSVPQPTRLQVDVYQVETSVDQMVSIDLPRLAREKPTRTELLAALRELGTARMIMRFDTVVDLNAETSLTNGRRVPVVQNYSVSPTGQKTPGISYEQIGARVDISGNWGEREKAGTADIGLKFEMSGVGQANLEIEAGKGMAAFNTLNIRQRLALESGRPTLIMNNQLPEPSDEKGRTVLTILRLMAERLDAKAGAQTKPAEEANAGPPALIHADILELTAKHDTLDAKAVAQLLPAGTTLEEGLEAIKKLGTAEILSSPSLLVKWPEDAVVSVGERVPVLNDVALDAAGKYVQKIEYPEVGLRMKFHGRWIEKGDSTYAELLMNVVLSSVEASNVKNPGGAGPTLPTFTTRTWDRKLLVEAGKSVWVTPDYPASQEGGKRSSLTLVRLTVDRAF